MSVPARFQPSVSGAPMVTDPATVPLGTAAWLTHSGSVLHPFREGDLYLGKLPNGDEVGFRDDRHALITAGTRSGKGVSLIIPNLVAWPGSLVVIDPKGENAKVTAARRAQGSAYCEGRGQKTCILDPFAEVLPGEGSSDLQGAFNPLDMLDADKDESVDIAARIAESLIVSESSNDPIWENSAKDALKGVILHVASWPDFLPEERNLVTVQRLLREGDQRARKLAMLAGDEDISAMKALFDAMGRNPAFSGVVAGTGLQLYELADSPRTLAGVLQVVRVNLSFLDSPGMKRLLVRSTFKISDLKTLPGGFSLFLSLPQRFIETHCRWLRMMTELIIGEMEQIRQQPACGYPVLMVLDEFPSLKRMRVLESAAAQIAGYGVKLIFVVQTLAQLKEIYKDNWETFISNAGVKLFFCNDDHFTRKYVSELIGDAEVTRVARTLSQTKGASWNENASLTVGGSAGQSMSDKGWSQSSGSSWSGAISRGHGGSESDTAGLNESIHKRALVTPDEVGRMFGDRDKPASLALISGYQPLRLLRTPYFLGLRWAGTFDAHPDHKPPMLKARLKEMRARAEAEKREAARRAEEARQRAAQAAEERKREAALSRQMRDAEIAANQRRYREGWHHKQRWARRAGKAVDFVCALAGWGLKIALFLLAFLLVFPVVMSWIRP